VGGPGESEYSTLIPKLKRDGGVDDKEAAAMLFDMMSGKSPKVPPTAQRTAEKLVGLWWNEVMRRARGNYLAVMGALFKVSNEGGSLFRTLLDRTLFTASDGGAERSRFHRKKKAPSDDAVDAIAAHQLEDIEALALTNGVDVDDVETFLNWVRIQTSTAIRIFLKSSNPSSDGKPLDFGLGKVEGLKFRGAYDPTEAQNAVLEHDTLTLQRITPDGECFFRSVGTAMNLSAAEVRRAIIRAVAANPQDYNDLMVGVSHRGFVAALTNVDWAHPAFDLLPVIAQRALGIQFRILEEDGQPAHGFTDGDFTLVRVRFPLEHYHLAQ